MAGKLMQARFPSKCAKCGGRIEAGADILYSSSAPKGQKATHAACGNADAPTPAPVQQSGSHVHFDSVEQLAALSAIYPAEAPADNRSKWTDLGSPSAVGGKSSEQWWGIRGATADDIMRLVRHGWGEGVTKMQEAFRDLGTDLPTPRTIKRRAAWADQGDSLDIHRVYSGQLDRAWRRMQPRTATGSPSVRIVADLAASVNSHAEAMFWNGAAALFVTDALTEAGYNVEVIGMRASMRAYVGEDCSAVSVTIKDALAPVEQNAFASALCMAGFFRLCMLRAQCHSQRHVGAGMGSPRTARDIGHVQPDDIDGLGLPIIKSADPKEAARAWIKSTIARINGEQLQAA